MAQILGLVVTLVSLTGSVLTQDRGICFSRVKPLKLKYFYPESVGYNITISAGPREESRWVLLFELLIIINPTL